MVTVYEIVVVPALTPVTTPLASTVAFDVETEVHVPPPAASAKLVVEPAQTMAVPVIVPAIGIGLTVTICVPATVPQLLVTV